MFEKGVAESEVVKVLIGKLRISNLRSRLTIIDGHFFSKNTQFGDTKRRISAVLEPFKERIQFLDIVTSPHDFNENYYNTLSNHLNFLSVTVTKNNDFHDRFWIVDENQAFIVGASINGIGKKHFFIQDDFLSYNNTQTLLLLYKNN